MLFQHFKVAPEIECRSLISADDKCYFVTHTPDCDNGVGFISYLAFLYCATYSTFIGGIFILASLLLLLFTALASATNNFFCPALAVMAKKMRMSDNIAGVTLLALGNGAPDIFSSLAGIRQGRAELVFGELFGAGIFVTTVVAGLICITTPFHVMERPFLRDCVFYMAAVFFVFCVFYQGRVALGHAVGFIVLYAAYVCVVLVARIVRKRTQRRRDAEGASHVEEPDPGVESRSRGSSDADAVPVNAEAVAAEIVPDDSIQVHPHDGGGGGVQILSESMDEAGAEDPSPPPPPSVWNNCRAEVEDLLDALKPFTVREWCAMTWYGKAVAVVEAPCNLVLKLTIPLVDEERPQEAWCRPLKCLQLAATPTWAVWALGYGDVVIAKILPLPLLVLLIGGSLSLMLALWTQRKRRPPGHWLWSVPAFAASILWIDLIISEILAILFTYGVVFQLSDAVLGLTVLAWGNSVGDMVADLSMARHAPRMGFSACYGAPLLNTMLGLGISFVAACSQAGQSVPVTFPVLSQTMTGFLLASLVVPFVYLPLCRFQADKRLGLILFSVYIAFIVLALLEEAHVF